MSTLPTFRPALRAARALAGVAKGLRLNWQQMEEVSHTLARLLESLQGLVEGHLTAASRAEWDGSWAALDGDIIVLRAALASLRDRVAKSELEGAADAWARTQQLAETLAGHYESLQRIGGGALPDDQRASWDELWDGVTANTSIMEAHAAACQLQLQMMEKHDKAEIDELTASILRHVPDSFSLAEAERYADEYVTALDEIERETKGKPNLWDRFLDALAGGPQQQSPAERVKMRRWLDGERGDL